MLFDVATSQVRHDIPVPVPPPANGRILIPSSDVAGLTFTPDGETVTALVNCFTLGFWDVATGHERLRIETPDARPIQGVAFSRDGRSLALDLGNGLTTVYETATGRQRRSFQATGGLAGGALIYNNTPFAQFGSKSPAVLYSTRPAAGVAFSRDGRLLAQSQADGTIGMWDLITKRELTPLKGHQGYATALAFSPDGNTLASGSRDTTVLLWDMQPFTAKAKPQTKDVDAAAAWKDLLSADAARAYDAICGLVAAPDKAVAYLREHLRPVAPPDPEKVKQLIDDLDSEQFDVRKRAGAELEKLGEPALHLLRKVLEGEPSLEARKRIEEILRNASMAKLPADTLRAVRAVEVLEMIGTVEAKAVLHALAKGAPDATTTRAANSSLERLGR